jgi:hypothetical protein
MVRIMECCHFLLSVGHLTTVKVCVKFQSDSRIADGLNWFWMCDSNRPHRQPVRTDQVLKPVDYIEAAVPEGRISGTADLEQTKFLSLLAVASGTYWCNSVCACARARACRVATALRASGMTYIPLFCVVTPDISDCAYMLVRPLFAKFVCNNRYWVMEEYFIGQLESLHCFTVRKKIK